MTFLASKFDGTTAGLSDWMELPPNAWFIPSYGRLSVCYQPEPRQSDQQSLTCDLEKNW